MVSAVYCLYNHRENRDIVTSRQAREFRAAQWKWGLPNPISELKSKKFLKDKTMLIRIIYVSSAVGQQTANMTNAILQGSQAWNKAHAITGVLCQGHGIFLQCLEGERRAVTQLYSRIYDDARHSSVELVHCQSIVKRRYEQWSMGHVDLSDIDPIRKIDWMEFDPYSDSGFEVLARIDEILTKGTAIPR